MSKDTYKLYKAILHTAGFRIEMDGNGSNHTEEEKEIAEKYMAAWDGVHVTVSNLLENEYSVVGWPPEEDEKVKNAIYLMEQDPVFGMYADDRERFDADWAAGAWEPSGSIIFPPKMVEVIGELKTKKRRKKK